MMIRFSRLAFVLCCLFVRDVFGQSGAEVEMADTLRRDGKIYTVVAGLALILIALIFFMVRVDRKIFRLENRMKKE